MFIITNNNFRKKVQFSLHKTSSINILMHLLFIHSFIQRVCGAYSVYSTISFFSSKDFVEAAFLALYMAYIKQKIYFGLIFCSDCLQQGPAV